MRETENEINLLVPGELFAPALGQPAWSFRPPDAGEADTDDEAEDIGDELGEPPAGDGAGS